MTELESDGVLELNISSEMDGENAYLVSPSFAASVRAHGRGYIDVAPGIQIETTDGHFRSIRITPVSHDESSRRVEPLSDELYRDVERVVTTLQSLISRLTQAQAA